MINHQKGNLIKMKANFLFYVKVALIVLFIAAGLLLCANEILGCKVNLWVGGELYISGCWGGGSYGTHI
ncbi:hypothetical protein PYX06_23715 [Citrobacter amalonaticus]|nr:hypothetical protein [Citrobacter amalonaticus]